MGMVVRGGRRFSDMGMSDDEEDDDDDNGDDDSTLECNNMKARMPALLYHKTKDQGTVGEQSAVRGSVRGYRAITVIRGI